jgi:hypothetical protein
MLVEFKNSKFTLGETLPTDILEYANFKGIDSNTCVLNNSSIDVNVEGTYNVVITCNNKEYNGKVEIIDMVELEVKTKRVFKSLNEEIKPEEFIESCNKEKCDYEFKDKEKVQSHLINPGTIFQVELIVKSGSKQLEVTSSLLVTEKPIVIGLHCSSPSVAVTEYSATKVTTDSFYFYRENGPQNAGFPRRTIEYTFSEETKFEEIVNTYKETKTFDGLLSEFNIDVEKKTMTTMMDMEQTALSLEHEGKLPTNFYELKLYLETKQYVCSLESITGNPPPEHVDY